MAPSTQAHLRIRGARAVSISARPRVFTSCITGYAGIRSSFRPGTLAVEARVRGTGAGSSFSALANRQDPRGKAASPISLGICACPPFPPLGVQAGKDCTRCSARSRPGFRIHAPRAYAPAGAQECSHGWSGRAGNAGPARETRGSERAVSQLAPAGAAEGITLSPRRSEVSACTRIARWPVGPPTGLSSAPSGQDPGVLAASTGSASAVCDGPTLHPWRQSAAPPGPTAAQSM